MTLLNSLGLPLSSNASTNARVLKISSQQFIKAYNTSISNNIASPQNSTTKKRDSRSVYQFSPDLLRRASSTKCDTKSVLPSCKRPYTQNMVQGPPNGCGPSGDEIFKQLFSNFLNAMAPTLTQPCSQHDQCFGKCGSIIS